MQPSRLSIAAFAALVALSAAAAGKEEFGTARDAEALVSRAVAHARKTGAQKAYQDFTAKAPGWTDRDLYVYVIDLQGVCLAHGQNPKLVGKNVLDLRDADGKLFIQENIAQARSRSRLWTSYTWTDPVTRKLLPKSTYCERLEETLYCVGIYKR